MLKFLVPLFLFSSLFAQTQVNVSPSEMNGEEQVVAKNNFDNLLAADDLVLQLRKNYGLKASVYLSKTMSQILSSFSTQEQAQNRWQTAINEAVELDNDLPPMVDFNFNTGQILSQYSHGMDLHKWTQNRIGFRINHDNLSYFLQLNDDLSIYLQLENVWMIFLQDIKKQENIDWQAVFINSLTIFSEKQQTTEPALTEVQSSLNDFFLTLKKWNQQDKERKDLSSIVAFIETANKTDLPLYISVLRYVLNKQQNHYLASAFSWFEVVYQLSSLDEVLTPEELDSINAFIEENDAWFLSKEMELLASDVKLPEKVESSIHALKLYFQNRKIDNQVIDEQVIDNQADNSDLLDSLPNTYQFIDADFDKYMQTPFRNKIRQDLEVCLNISEEFAPYPQQPIDANQFNGCFNDLTYAATVDAKSRELSGSLTKVDTKQALDRALQQPPWQSINILKARLAQANCLDESQQTVNPLEWTLAAESLLWFIDRWPAYFQHYPNQKNLNKIIKEGENLTRQWHCLDKPMQELLNIEFSQVAQSWQKVKTNIKQVALEFNQNSLTQGSDLDLLANAEKPSNYRVEDAKIEACDAQNSCGVHVSLDSSRALYGLFPNHLLVADQLKMGKLKLCYDNVGWENRRSASTHLDNPSVANYFGNFSFSIKGYYDDKLVFEKKLTSQQESYYLFAENSDEVLSSYCPLSIVGKKISTKLDRGTFGLVPNRLTFLTASRASESHILSSNWIAGEEWQDQIVSVDTPLVSENKLPELSSQVQSVYQNKAKELQDLIYQSLLTQVQEPSEKQQQLIDSIADMYRMKKLFSYMVYLTQADDYMVDDVLHGLFFGSEKIPDKSSIEDFYQNQVNIMQFISSMDENIKINQNKWNNFSPSWSNAYLKNIIYRLKSL